MLYFTPVAKLKLCGFFFFFLFFFQKRNGFKLVSALYAT